MKQGEIVFQNDKGVTRIPASEVELNQLVVEPQWGHDTLNPELNLKLSKAKYVKVKKGTTLQNSDGTKRTLTEDELISVDEYFWSELNFYRQDLRLGNLDRSERVYCNHYLLLAADFLRKEMYEAFIVALNRVISKIELSQSKDGFLRKWFGTVRKLEGQDEPEKPRLPFGGKNPK